MTNTLRNKLLLGAAGAAIALGGAAISSPAHATLAVDGNDNAAFTPGVGDPASIADDANISADGTGHDVQVQGNVKVKMDAASRVWGLDSNSLAAVTTNATGYTLQIEDQFAGGAAELDIVGTADGAIQHTGGALNVTVLGDTTANNGLTVDINGLVDLGTGAFTLNATGGNGNDSDVTVNFDSNVTATGGIILNADGTKTATVLFDGTAAQTITGIVKAAGQGEGFVNITNTGGLVTFANDVGVSAGNLQVNEVNIGGASGTTSTVLFSGNVNVDATGTGDGDLSIGQTDGGGATVTFMDDVTAASITLGTGAGTNSTQTVTFNSSGGATTVTGAIAGGDAGDTNALIVTSGGTVANTVSFATDMGANIDTLTVAANTDLIAKNITTSGNITLNSGSILRNAADADVIAGNIVAASNGVGTLRADNSLVVQGNIGSSTASLAGISVDAAETLTFDGATGSIAIDVYSDIALSGAGAGLVIAADNDATKAVTLHGNITATVADQGTIVVTDATVNDRFVVNGNIGTATNKILSINLGADVVNTATFAGNVYTGTLTLDDETDSVLLTGGTSTSGVVFDGNIQGAAAGEGTVQVGNGASDTAFVTFDDGISDGVNNIDFFDIQTGSQATISGNDVEITADAAGSEGLNVDGTLVLTSSNTIADTDMLITDTVGDMDFNGTFTINGSNGVDVTAASDIFLDGVLNVNLASTENVTLTATGSAISIGFADNADAAVRDGREADLNLNNQVVLASNTAIGNSATDVTRLTISSNSVYDATTAANVAVDANANFNIAAGYLEVTVGTLENFDAGDQIYAIDTNGGTFQVAGAGSAFTTAGVVSSTGSIRIVDTAVLNLEAGAATDADTLTLSATLNNLNNVFSSGTYVNAGNALFAAPSSAGGNLGTIRSNFLGNASSAAVEDIAEAVSPTVDGGSIVGAMGASAQAVSVNNSRLASLRTGDQTGMVAGNLAEGLKAWGQVFGSTAEQDRRDGVDGYEADTFGFALGIDTETLADNWIWGLSFAYADTEVDSDNANSTNTEIDSYQIGVYANYDWDERTYVTGQLAYVFGDNDSRRSNVGGISGLTASGDYDSDQIVARFEAGRNYSFNETTTVTPSVLLNYAYYDADSYSETGAGNAGLTVNSEDISVLELGVGVDASWLYQQADGSYLKPEVRAGVRYDFLDEEVESTASFVGVAGTSFKTKGFDPAQTTFNLGLGLTYFSTTNWELSADYDFEVKEDFDSHAGVLRAAYKF